MYKFAVSSMKKTYAERKEEARQEAIEWQYTNGDYQYSMEGWCIIAAHFRKLGKRYGLLREFEENGIPI